MASERSNPAFRVIEKLPRQTRLATVRCQRIGDIACSAVQDPFVTGPMSQPVPVFSFHRFHFEHKYGVPAPRSKSYRPLRGEKNS